MTAVAKCRECGRLRPAGATLRVVDRLDGSRFHVCRPGSAGDALAGVCFRKVGPRDRFEIAPAEEVTA